jgi:hypothetical protein
MGAGATAYLAVASAIALQLSGTIHLAVVQHAICAEHGEAMDVGEPEHAHARHAGALPAADSGQPRLSMSVGATERPAHEPGSDEDSHHHCPLDEDRNTHALVVYAASISPLSASPIELAPPRTAPVRADSRDLHRLAPKTSPPV